MSKHIETVHISTDEFARINRLLNMGSFEDMSDEEMEECGANANDSEKVFEVTFDDGSSLSYYLCSGNCNYWEDTVWTDASGNIDVCPLEPTYDLNDIELDIMGETYIVKIIKD